MFKIGQVFDPLRFLLRLAKKVRWTLVH